MGADAKKESLSIQLKFSEGLHNSPRKFVIKSLNINVTKA
ncbi:hypothetical protein GNIT_1428 [Glaciecola nitratireducens FR1064]|uniref:Uncharacterized protein n=1 Tax=Glaciecola nitratireducens (strain JCM 12485 / KCTC 12276 / FR1064) TaxID=1085623 RepID=G4QL76_GLANF|nr:hypothetical protein GNIT_1428 [Glaciecola nitratireducens FR1064]